MFKRIKPIEIFFNLKVKNNKVVSKRFPNTPHVFKIYFKLIFIEMLNNRAKNNPLHAMIVQNYTETLEKMFVWGGGVVLALFPPTSPHSVFFPNFQCNFCTNIQTFESVKKLSEIYLKFNFKKFW